MDLSTLTDEEMIRFQRETLRRMISIAEAEGHSFIAIAYKSGMGIMMDTFAETDISEVMEAKDA